METPTLLIAWRRPQSVRKVIDALRHVSAQRLFVACDGPRFDSPEDCVKVAETRAVIESQIDWKCDVSKLYSDGNQGCRLGVSRAISWFFNNVQEGIVLEDDCVPHPDFFSYCSSLLLKYRQDERVWCVSGNNFLAGRMREDASYYFSKYPHCWGWATWRRAWMNFSGGIDFWPEWKQSSRWSEVCSNPLERQYWQGIFERCYAGQIDSWAYPWTATLWQAGAVTAIPNVNLVQNIGFGEDATHTRDGNHSLSISTKPLPEIHHPREVLVDNEADAYVFKTIFCPAQADRMESSHWGSGALWLRLRGILTSLKCKLSYSKDQSKYL